MGGAVPAPRGGVAAPTRAAAARAPVGSAAAAMRPRRSPLPEGAPTAAFRSLEDIVALCEPRSELRVNLEHNVHLVRLEPGRSKSGPTPRAPRTLASDLQQKLRAATGERWMVSIASQGGAPTLAEQKQAAKTARFEAVAQEPMVRAVLDRFPGAEIVAVRDVVAEEIAPRRCRKAIRILMAAIGSEIERLIQLLAKLPGLGPRSARRAALALLKKRDTLLEPLADAMREAADAILTCEVCGNLDTQTPLRHLQRSAPRSAYPLRGGRCRRSVGAGARRRVPRPLSCAGRGAVGAGWRDAGTAECRARCWSA